MDDAEDDPKEYMLYALRSDHRCGCVPSKLALLDVANRVCPKKPLTNRPPPLLILYSDLFHPLKFPVSLSQLSFATLCRTPFERSVRLALTTRDRTPRSGGGLPGDLVAEYWVGSKVTTPPDWAPLIIVTLTIFSNTSNAVLPPSIFNQEGFKSNTPKLPQKQISDEESWRYGWMGVNPNKSVTIASMAVMYATIGSVGWRKRFNILDLICLLSNDELCLS
mmetsp:Transcript_13686/g.24744  ORF Transcript_13686/g.24744 Transcript_13686/m.24744 type:complete len:221 (-) Transcript_13686:354-1016(-)